MAKHNKYPSIDPRITRIIARAAERVTWKLGFTESFIHDVEQDLHITVSSALPYLRTPHLELAIQQIVKNRAIDIIRWHQRECRTRRAEAFSLNEPCLEDGSTDDQIGETVDLELQNSSYHGLAPSWHMHRDASADISDALAKLPEDLRRLADALDASGGNLVEAARLFRLTNKKARIMRERLKITLKRILNGGF